MDENLEQSPDVAAREAAIQQNMESAFAALQGGEPPQVPQPTPQQAPQPAPQQGAQPKDPPTLEPRPATSPTAAPTTEAQLRGMFADPTPDKPAAVPELPPDTPIEQPEGLGDRAGNAWAQLRARERQLRQFVEDQKRQLDDMRRAQEKADKERGQLAEALKTRDSELKDLRERAGRLDLSASVEFRSRYDQPMGQAEANLDAVLQRGIEGTDTPEGLAEVRRHVMADDRSFQAYVSDLDESLQDAIRAKRQTLLEVKAERDAALKDWETTARGLSQTAAAESVADKLLNRQRLAEAAEQFNLQATPVDKRPLVLTEAYFADDVALANKAFKDFMQTATEEQIARAAHMGHLVPTMQRALVYALNQARQYQEAYYAVRGIAKPGSFAAPGSVATPPAPAVPKATPVPPTPTEAKDNAIADSIRGILMGRPPVGGQG